MVGNGRWGRDILSRLGFNVASMRRGLVVGATLLGGGNGRIGEVLFGGDVHRHCLEIGQREKRITSGEKKKKKKKGLLHVEWDWDWDWD